jgi:recombination protein RecT
VVGQGTDIVKAADSEQLIGALKKAHGTLVAFLGTPEMAQRAVRVAWVLVRRTPDLQKCSIESIIAGMLQSAQFRLELGTEAYLVPFKNKELGTYEAVFIPDWKGLVRLAIGAGALTTGHGDLVYKGDEYLHEQTAEGVRFRHVRQRFGARAAVDKVEEHLKAGCEGVYFIGHRTDGPPVVAEMRVAEVEYVRATYSRAPNGDLWVKRWSAGAIKTVTKQGLKLVRMTPTLQQAIELDNRQETGLKTAVLEGDEIEVRPLTEPRPVGAVSPPAPQPTEEQVRAEEAKMVAKEK